MRAFEAAGAFLYNEIVLVNAVGSLRLRAKGAFEASRKTGRTHQDVLVFCKGDPKRATQAIKDAGDEALPEGENGDG